MATFNPTLISRYGGRIFAATLLLAPMAIVTHADASGLAERELTRRGQSVSEAMELLRKGDDAYLDGDYRTAVEAFAGAREMIPNAPATAEFHAAATERFATASVEHARLLSRQGDVAAGIAAVERVLAPAVAPNHPGAMRMLNELNDPIRTNPALTAEHAADIDQVRRLIYTAEGAFNLGKFDEAAARFQDVIRIDPHNQAARRGMERVANAKSNYYRTGYDHTRGELLAQVDAGWEMQVPPIEDIPIFEDGPLRRDGDPLWIPVATKIERIMIPVFRADQVSLAEALDLLRVRARENDTMETDEARRGININLILGDTDPEIAAAIRARRFDLQLTNVSVAAILRYLSDLTDTNFTTDDFSVIIRSLATFRDEFVNRTFRVPPDFVNSISSGASAGGGQQDDPFAPAPTGGLLAQRLGIREAFEANGIQFPEGTSVNLTGNLLRVTHNASVMEVIEQLVNAAAETEPVAIVTRLTVVRVQETRLKELGFDWLLGDFRIGGGGNDDLSVSGGTRGTGGDLSDLDPLLIGPMNPITSGNRSGNEAILRRSIDSEIAASNFGSRQSSIRAPGILSVAGVMNNTTAQVVMRGLNQSTGVDTMQNPQVVTRSGQAATVQVVREFIYPTEYEPPEVPNSVGFGLGEGSLPVTPATPTAFDKRDVGMTLEVLPVADASRNYVDLTIAPEFVDFDGFINYGSPIQTSIDGGPFVGTQTVEVTRNAILMPVFNAQRLNTSVTIADGSTVVIGGLLSTTLQNVEDRTPILGDLPIVGRFFQSNAREPVKTAIIFFVSVELVDPTGRPYRDR